MRYKLTLESGLVALPNNGIDLDQYVMDALQKGETIKSIEVIDDGRETEYTGT